MMKIGDKKQHSVVKFTGDRKKDTLACFENLLEQEQENSLLELEKKKRDVNEAAKRRF